MDQELLVKETSRLIELMDTASIPPKGVLLVRDLGSGNWRIWIVPPSQFQKKRKRDFNAEVTFLLLRNQSEFSALTNSIIDLRFPEYPAIKILGKICRAEGITRIEFTACIFNGFSLPDSIILRMVI